ncbi:MAG: hypothetical protein ABEH77_05555 [Halobacteriaceae archaeon]
MADADPSDGESDAGEGGEPAPEAERSADEAPAPGEVAEKYDFEDFGPRQMEEMTAAEWEAAFDPDSWVTGTALLDRVEADLEARIARRDVFAVVEREPAGAGERLVAYSDTGYALVYEDGTVEGRGTVLRDVKPSVALCSMPDYEVPEVEAAGLPDPDDVVEGTGQLGNRVLQAVAAVQLLAGAGLLVAPLVVDPLLRAFCAPAGEAFACRVGGATARVYPLGESLLIAVVAGLGFLAFGAFLLVVVANARLSDRFRAEEYRERLREAGVETDERPEFVPDPEEPVGGRDGDATPPDESG